MILTVVIILVACLSIQILFLLGFYFSLITYKPLQSKNPNFGISVIIAAHNEAENLKILLPKLLSQRYFQFEIIIIDDRSSDNTANIIEEFKSDILKYFRVEKVKGKTNPKKYALALGIEKSQYETILLTDADCIPSSNKWIYQMASYYNNDKEIILGLSFYNRNKGMLNQFIRYETIYTALQYASFTLLGNPYMGIGRNMSFKKKLFVKFNGYAGIEHIVGGDDDLLIQKMGNKKNTTIAISNSSITYSQPEVTLKDFLRQKTRHLSVGKYYKTKDKLILGIFHFSTFMYFLLGIIFAIIVNEPLLVIWGLVIRWFLLIIAFDRLIKKSGEKFEIAYIAFLDIVYLLYYAFTGIRAIFAKRIKWN